MRDRFIDLDALPLALIDIPSSTLQATKADAIHADHLGTPMRLTDTTGTVVWALDSTPFDAIHGAFGLPNEDVDLNGISITYNARFPGQYFDAETGLNYNYFRDYDPGTGRYIQSDPIGLAGGLNTYGYVGGNPLVYVDPLGLFNPAKGLSALGNGVIAAWTAASGATKWTAAAGLSGSGIGAAPAAGLYAWGAWNFRGSKAAFDRGNQQLQEAFCEDWSQADWKNLWGVAPGGTHYDDPGEYSGPWDYIQNRGWWEWLMDAGYF